MSQPSLKERWDQLDAREAKHEKEGAALEDERWAVAKELHDEWNPHNVEPPAPPKHPRGGKSQGQLAREMGRSQAEISKWITVHRNHSSEDIMFWDAMKLVRGVTQDKAREYQHRSGARQQLRNEPEAVAPEIAKALSNPEVAAKVMAEMKFEARDKLGKAKDRQDREDVAYLVHATSRSNGSPPRKRPVDPWKLFRQLMRLADELHEQVHPDMWELPSEVFAHYLEGADDRVEFLTGFVETAQQKAKESRSAADLKKAADAAKEQR
jgi:hypothetical protein